MLPYPLNVDRPSIGVENALVHRLRQRRMREDGVDQFRLGRLAIHRDHKTLDKFGDLRANHMGAQELSGRGVKDRLDEPSGSPSAIALPLPMKGKRPILRSIVRRHGLFFGKANGSDLRMAIGAAGNTFVQGMRVWPLIASTQMTPSCSALWASIGGPATSPIA